MPTYLQQPHVHCLNAFICKRRGYCDTKRCENGWQVEKLDASYPGGLVAYLRRAKKFLADQKGETHNFDGYTPSVISAFLSL